MMKKYNFALFLGIFSFAVYADSVGVVAPLDAARGWSNLTTLPSLTQVQGVQVAGAQTFWFLGADAQKQETMIFSTAPKEFSVVACPFNNISALMPAYPETGESAAAWAITPPTGGTTQSYYFDGREWSQPQALSFYPSGFQSSKGYGWLVDQTAQGRSQVSYFDAGSRSWVNIPSLEFGSDISDAAADGYLYILSEDKDTHTLTMYRVDGMGHWELLSLPRITTDEMRAVTILAENNFVFLYWDSQASAIVYYSNDEGNTWQNISENAPIVPVFQGQDTFSLVNGIVRLPGKDAYGAYIDLKQNPIWHYIPLPPSYSYYYTFYPDVSADGSEHCEFLETQGDQVEVGCFDIHSQSWNISPVVPLSSPDMKMIAVLGHDRVAFVGQDEAGVATGFYYNGSTWVMKKFAGVSDFSGSVTTSSYFNANNIWAGGTKN